MLHTAIDCIHTTAASHGRVFIVEVMGHKVGWLTLHAGIAGGADIILIPEIPYDIDKVIEAIETRGTRRASGLPSWRWQRAPFPRRMRPFPRKNIRKNWRTAKYPSISYELAQQIQERSGVEVRITVPGHTQRGGSPCPYDRVLSTRLGAKAAELIMNGDYWLYGCREE